MISPYQLYPEQQKYLEKIRDVTKNGGLLLIEAGTGFGKTVANLLGGLTFLDSPGSQLIYLTRTLQQSLQVIEELRQINKNNPTTPISGIQLTSRKRLCKFEDVKKVKDPEEAWELCKAHRKEREMTRGTKSYDCRSIVSEIEKSTGVPKVVSIENLQDFAEHHRGCAFLTSRELMGDRNVICGSYFYYLISDVRKKLKLETGQFSKILVVFDEGHNLDNAAIDAYRDDIDILAIRRAKRELNLSQDIIGSSLYHQGKDFFSILERKCETDFPNLFKKKSLISSTIWDRILKELNWTSLEYQKISKELLSLNQHIKDDWNSKTSEKVVGKLAYERLLLLLKGVIMKDMCFIASWNPKTIRPQIVIDLVDPTFLLKDVFSTTRNLVLCSASLTPVEFHKSLLGISPTESVVYGGIANPSNVRVFHTGRIADHTLSTQYNFLQTHPGTHRHYRQAIYSIASKVKGGTLVLFPNYRQRDEVLGDDFVDIPIIRESWSNGDQFTGLREEYFSKVDTHNRAIFAGVFRGRIAEGADFPNQYSRAVIICGIPYDPPVPNISARRAFYEKKQLGMGWEWYRLKAYQRVLQALGRGWRNATDYAVGVLLDNRYNNGEFLRYFPEWLSTKTKYKENINALIQEVETFFAQDRSDQVSPKTRVLWQTINQQFIAPAQNFQNQGKLKEAENWLLHGYIQTKDGWIAYHLGNILRLQNQFEKAQEFYRLAERALPLRRYKQLAQQALADLQNKIQPVVTSCILCGNTAINGIKCSSCNRMICSACMIDMSEVGKQTCPYCGGNYKSKIFFEGK